MAEGVAAELLALRGVEQAGVCGECLMVVVDCEQCIRLVLVQQGVAAEAAGPARGLGVGGEDMVRV